MNFNYLLICLIFVAFGGGSLGAQPVKSEIDDYRIRKMASDSCLQILKKGTLIVGLPTYSKKRVALQQVIDNPSTSKLSKKSFTKQLAALEEEIDVLHPSMIKGMKQFYTYSDFVITYDTLLTKILEGKEGDYFLNLDGQIDSSISFDKENYLILRYGTNNANDVNQKKGFIVTDRYLTDLKSPFPALHRIEKNSLGIATFFKPNENHHLPARRLVQKMNDRFIRKEEKIQYRLDK